MDEDDQPLHPIGLVGHQLQGGRMRPGSPAFQRARQGALGTQPQLVPPCGGPPGHAPRAGWTAQPPRPGGDVRFTEWAGNRLPVPLWRERKHIDLRMPSPAFLRKVMLKQLSPRRS